MGTTPATAVTMVAGARTAVRPVDGELAGWNPVALAGAVGREALERAGLDAGVLDEVVVGCCDPVGAAGADVARAIVLAAGWPVSVGGSVIDRGETSGAAAVQAAVAAIRAGQARTVLVVGLGLCSVVPPGAAALNRAYGAPWGGVAERFEEVGGLLPAPRLSERAAQAAGIGRAELDAAAEESRRRRAEAESAAGSTEGSGSAAGAAGSTEGSGSAAGAAGSTEGSGSAAGAAGSTEGSGSAAGAAGSTEGSGSAAGAAGSTEGSGSAAGAAGSTEGSGSAAGAAGSTEGSGSAAGAAGSTEGSGSAAGAAGSTEGSGSAAGAAGSTEGSGSAAGAAGSTEGSGSAAGAAGSTEGSGSAAGATSAASPAIVAVAARPGDAAGPGVYRGDPVAADGLRDWGDAAELPPAFDDDGLLTAATFAPPADCVTAVLLQAGEAPVPGGVAGTGQAGDPSDPVGNVAVAVGRAPGGMAAVAGTGRAAGDPFDPVGNVAAAVGRALGDAGVELSAVDGISVVEHDAATAMLVARALDIDAERINRDGGAVATGNAGAAEELRLITDALALTGGERLLLTISAGPTGSAAIVWRKDI